MNASLLFFFLGLASSYLIIRPIATLVHEAGHLLVLLLGGMQGQIRVFLGSLGDGKRSWRMQTGRILWAIHPSVFLMRGSLSDYDHPLLGGRWLLATLGGPLASLLFCLGATWMATAAWADGAIRGLFILAAIIGAADVALSLIYRYDPIQLSNGRITANDGQLIGWKLKFGRDTDTYLHARWCFEKDRYAETINCVQKLVDSGHQDKMLFEYCMYSHLMLRQPALAIQLLEMQDQQQLDAYDESLYGLALEQVGKADAARKALVRALAKAPGHHEALNHRAYICLQAREWDAAEGYLLRALRSHPEFAAALNNRATIRLQQRELEAARKDLVSALMQDHENPYIHYNWGVLLRMEGDDVGAEAYFENARLLGLVERAKS